MLNCITADLQKLAQLLHLLACFVAAQNCGSSYKMDYYVSRIYGLIGILELIHLPALILGFQKVVFTTWIVHLLYVYYSSGMHWK